MKKTVLLLVLILFAFSIQADSIANYTVPASARLGEKISVSGNYVDGNSFILCKFVIEDSNGNALDRWTDEYTFSDASFYAEKILLEPPYYRGDDFNIITTCGTAQASTTFAVEQPVSLAHPIQKTWEYAFDEFNLDAIMIFVSFIALIVIFVLGITFFKKLGKHYAS